MVLVKASELKKLLEGVSDDSFLRPLYDPATNGIVWDVMTKEDAEEGFAQLAAQAESQGSCSGCQGCPDPCDQQEKE